MKKRYRLVRRGERNTFYCFDTHTKKRETLRTSKAADARRLVDVRNEAVRHPSMNLQIAQVYLQHADSALAARTWQGVLSAAFFLASSQVGHWLGTFIFDRQYVRSERVRFSPIAIC